MNLLQKLHVPAIKLAFAAKAAEVSFFMDHKIQ
jgi:hypothetical protein